MEAIFKKYKNATIRWVQEEPANMGAWTYILFNMNGKHPIQLVSREAAASPAVGFKKLHDMQQAALVERAFEK